MTRHDIDCSGAAALTVKEFDRASGSYLERLLFNYRGIVLFACVLVTVALGFQLTRLRLNADFESTIPTRHPSIVNYLANRAELGEVGNSLRIAVANPTGSIYEPAYLATLQRISDEVLLLPGVDRQYMKSLWTPSTVWTAATEQGLDSGPVMPPGFDGSPLAINQLQFNVSRSGEIGQLVANDQRSSIIRVPLLNQNPDSGKPLDYADFADRLERVRARYESQGVNIHITGYAQIVGDIIKALRQIMLFFGVAVAITIGVLYAYTRCLRSTALVVSCSLVALIWQLGILPLLGLELDPYSILVPFLVFAIGISHGAQKMNGIMQDIGRGAERLVAARLTFRRLFIAGLTALLCDVVGFAILLMVDIASIRQLALTASLGVAILIFTNLILLPILLSYVGVSTAAAQRSIAGDSTGGAALLVMRRLVLFTRRRWALAAIVVALGLAAAGSELRSRLKVGDLDPGAPELRADSRYNRDSAFIATHYDAGADVFAVMVKTADGNCGSHEILRRIDALEWQLAQLPGVQFTRSAASFDRYLLTAFNEGNPKWYDLTPNGSLLNNLTARVPRDLINESCNLLTIYAHLADHKADTLSAVVATVEQFKRDNDNQEAEFQLAAGNAGIEAATNIVVKQASQRMLVWVYGAVALLCLVTFRSWRAVIVVIVPLILTSILCEALMVMLGIGVKVTTLPVIALGVGIGVDYALYIMSMTLSQLRSGATLSQAYGAALGFTGKVVMLTGVSLAVSVATWVLSPIKFQADMGVLLAFMFLWNMLGALVLLPALASFLFPSVRAPTLHDQADMLASARNPVVFAVARSGFDQDDAVVSLGNKGPVVDSQARNAAAHGCRNIASAR